MKTGMVGLGAMGAPMAVNLHKSGMLACAWNRTQVMAERLAASHGINIVASVGDLAAICDVVIVSVSRDADLLQVVRSLATGLCSGSLVVDTSTVGADTAIEAAHLLAKTEIAFLDAPVSGGTEGAKTGKLAMMVGGDESILARARPALAKLASRIVHMGPVGSGQATKAVNQVMAAGINQAVTEALAFGQVMGLNMEKVVEVVGNGAAGNWFLNHRGPSMLRQEFTPGFKLALHHKDLRICKHMAEKFNLRLPIVEMTLIHYQRLLDSGYGDEDISALFRQKQMLAKEPG